MATKAAKSVKKPVVKKTVATKKPAVKKAAPAKAKPAAAAKKPAAAKGVNKKGTKYTCSVCGMVVAIDTVCNCVGVCDLICCEKPMKVAGK